MTANEEKDEPLQKVNVKLQLALYALNVAQPELIVKVIFFPPLLVDHVALPDVFTHVQVFRYITIWFAPLGTVLKVYSGPPFSVPVRGIGGLKNEAQRNVKPDLLRTVPRDRTTL